MMFTSHRVAEHGSGEEHRHEYEELRVQIRHQQSQAETHDAEELVASGI